MVDPWQHWGLSEIGPGHVHQGLPNQDSYYSTDAPWGEMIAVCDGMGSRPHSDIGSALACQAVYQALSNWYAEKAELLAAFLRPLAQPEIASQASISSTASPVAQPWSKMTDTSTAVAVPFNLQEGTSSLSSYSNFQSELVQRYGLPQITTYELNALVNWSFLSADLLIRIHQLWCNSIKPYAENDCCTTCLFAAHFSRLHLCVITQIGDGLVALAKAPVKTCQAVAATPQVQTAEPCAHTGNLAQGAPNLQASQTAQTEKLSSQVAAASVPDCAKVILDNGAVKDLTAASQALLATTSDKLHPSSVANPESVAAGVSKSPASRVKKSKKQMRKHRAKHKSSSHQASKAPKHTKIAVAIDKVLAQHVEALPQDASFNASCAQSAAAKVDTKGKENQPHSAPSLDHAASAPTAPLRQDDVVDQDAGIKTSAAETDRATTILQPESHSKIMPSQIVLPFDMDDKAFANVTYGLGPVLNLAQWRMLWIPDNLIDAVMLTTDGIADDLESHLKPDFVAEILDSSRKMSQSEITAELRKMLQNWPTPKHTDDKTLACLNRPW